jgi:hypothetical protein
MPPLVLSSMPRGAPRLDALSGRVNLAPRFLGQPPLQKKLGSGGVCRQIHPRPIFAVCICF